MKASVQWVDGVHFQGRTGSGHTVEIDGAAEFGGRNAGARPMEMLLLGLCSCTAFDVVHILRRGRHEVAGCEVTVQAKRADREPKVFTHLHLNYVLRGRDLKEAAVRRAIELSATKYCSASIMLAQTAELSHDWKIIEADH